MDGSERRYGMQSEDRGRRLEERKEWVGRIVPHIRAGRIVEFGCGSGLVLEFLAGRFPESTFVGVDRSLERLAALGSLSLSNVLPVRGEITDPMFPKGVFTTALFIGVLHEIYSDLGQERVHDMLRYAHGVLDEDGVVIIQDFLKPPPRMVEITFKNDATHKKFLRFTREFEARKIPYEASASTVRLDMADAVEFISKYRSPDEDDWSHEMHETHFAFTEDDQRRAAQSAGFRVTQAEHLHAQRHRVAEFKQDMEFDFEAVYTWIQLVLEKEER